MRPLTYDGLVFVTAVQVLATVISQAKLVVGEILEPSASNEYAQVVSSLPAVQDLCLAVFNSSRPPLATPGSTALRADPMATALMRRRQGDSQVSVQAAATHDASAGRTVSNLM